MAKTSLTSKGRIVIPKQIRNDLNLKEGNTLAFEIRDDALLITPHPIFPETQPEDFLGRMKTDKKITLEEIDEAVETAMREHFLKEGYRIR